MVKNKFIGVMKTVMILLLMFLNFNCERHSFKKDDELSLKPTEYESNQLRIDGYYYVTNFNDPQKSMEVFVYFQNGTFSYFGGGFKNFSDIENRLINTNSIEKLKNIKYCWGIYVIDNDKIKFERWYPGQGAIKAYVREGRILNDTTFHITKSYRSDGSEERDKDELYHFRPFSPKPDSTNIFIK